MTTRELETAALPYKRADPSRYSIRGGQTPLLRGADFGFYDQKRWKCWLRQGQTAPPQSCIELSRWQLKKAITKLVAAERLRLCAPMLLPLSVGKSWKSVMRRAPNQKKRRETCRQSRMSQCEMIERMYVGQGRKKEDVQHKTALTRPKPSATPAPRTTLETIIPPMLPCASGCTGCRYIVCGLGSPTIVVSFVRVFQ